MSEACECVSRGQYWQFAVTGVVSGSCCCCSRRCDGRARLERAGRLDLSELKLALKNQNKGAGEGFVITELIVTLLFVEMYLCLDSVQFT